MPASKIHYVGRNKDFEVSCEPPDGNPVPVAYWQKNNAKITSFGRITVKDNLKLKISVAQLSDQGDYQCVAENLAGKSVGSIKIIVTNAPKITYQPSSKDVVEGSSVELKCGYEGDLFPVTVIEWRKSGVVLTPSPRDSHLKIFGHNGTLFFDHVTKNDTAHYDCVVKTGGQDPLVSKHAILTVIEKLKFAPKPVGRKLAFGSNAQIPCVAVGHFSPKIKWFPVNGANQNASMPPKFDLSKTFPPNVREKNGILYFNAVRFEDAGFYACTATSSQGLIHETIKVEVYVFPTVIQAPRNMSLILGSEAWLHCVVEGKPKPKIEWYHEGKVEAEKWKFNYNRLENNTIHISNVTLDHAGLYVCMAGNSGGFKRLEAYLCVKNPYNHLSNCGPNKPAIIAPFSDLEYGNQNGHFGAGNLGASSSNDLVFSQSKNLNNGSSKNTVIIAVSLACGYFFLVVFIVGYCSFKRSRARMAKMTAVAGQISNSNGGVMLQLTNQNSTTQSPPRVGQNFRNRAGHADFATNGDGEILLGAPTNFPMQSLDSSVMGSLRGNGLSPSRNVAQHPAASYIHAINGSSSIYHADGRNSPTAASSIISSSNCDMEKLKYARTSLEFIRCLGFGLFGEVHLMKIAYNTNRSTGADQSQHSNKIAMVKQFTNTTDDFAGPELNRELEMYSKLSHANIVKLIGVCVEKEPVLVVYEYLEYGNLKHYFQASMANYENLRSSSPGAFGRPLTSAQILKILHQVCKAMEYLSSQNLVHKDLAARNVLISSGFSAKLGHLGLSQEPFQADYISLGRRRVPLRWLPCEAALDDEHSSASDVFSFATLVWETYAGDAKLPHGHLTDDQMVDLARRQQMPVLAPPTLAPEELRHVLVRCWSEDERQRPGFSEISDILERCLAECDV